jgi:hypothetical protein
LRRSPQAHYTDLREPYEPHPICPLSMAIARLDPAWGGAKEFTGGV